MKTGTKVVTMNTFTEQREEEWVVYLEGNAGVEKIDFNAKIRAFEDALGAQGISLATRCAKL